MALETALVIAAILGIIAYGIKRRRHRVFHEYKHQENLECEVSFYDRAQTLVLIEAYFEKEYIRVVDLKREIRREGERELFINTYHLQMPQRAQQGAMVGYLSALETVRSVQIKPL